MRKQLYRIIEKSLKMGNKICFITTGDIKNIATAKRALGMAAPLVELGWNVSILMEDTEENRHRVKMECCNKVQVYYFPHCSALKEIKVKNKLIKDIDPDFIYICAFVTRNTVGIGYRCRKLVEHSELQSGISEMTGLRKLHCYLNEYFSIIYSDALINASKYLQTVYKKRCKRMLFFKRPNFYHPYAFSEGVMDVKLIDRSSSCFKQYEGRKIFTFLGTITRNYGVFTIIKAIEELKKKYPEVLLMMYGRGRHYQEACDYVKKQGLDTWIKLPGFITEEDISTYFSLTDYFISPMNDTVQDWARCPSKLYMYLPYKKPIITCKIGEPYEVLREEGFYYEPSNVDSLLSVMDNLIKSGKTQIDINPEGHSWLTRTKEFNIWIKETFLK